MNFIRGDFVMLEFKGRCLRAMVVLASQNGDSLMAMFDGMLGGYVGMMPIRRCDDGEYRDVMKGEIVKVTLP